MLLWLACACAGLQRFPRWMWRNTSVAPFIEWLKDHNTNIAHGSGGASEGEGLDEG